MTKAEFLEILENKLTGEVDAEKVRRNLQYYNSYIDAAIRDGKTESQVLEELGSPLLIARTIIDTSGGNESCGAYEAREEQEQRNNHGGFHLEMNDKTAKIVLIAAVVVILVLLFTVLRILLPVLLPVLLILLVISLFKKR